MVAKKQKENKELQVQINKVDTEITVPEYMKDRLKNIKNKVLDIQNNVKILVKQETEKQTQAIEGKD